MPSPRNSTVTVRAPSSPNDYRQRIINLVAMHEPSKLGTLNVALSHFQGREEKLLSTLSTRLGSEPTPQEVTELAEHMKSFPPTSPRAKDSTTPRVSPTSPRAKLLQTRVVNLYRKYRPDRLKEIKSILAAIAGREEQALQMLVKKYGPEPTQEEISAMPPVTPRLNATTPQSRFASPRVSVTSTSTPHTTIQQRIKNILLKYDREKVDQINFESEKIRGHEEQILNTLVQKYGPEPTLAEVVVLEQQAKDNSSSEYQMYRTRVSSMLRRYNPSKLGTEDTILSMYRGKEEELLRSMIAKYGPEPSAESNATPAPSASSTPGPKSSWQSTSALKSPRSRPLSPQVDSVNFSQLVVTVPHGLESNNNSRITSPQDLPICTNIFSNADQHPNFRARVGNMYIKYAPQKLTDLSHDVLKHIGREEVHMKELVAQYGPEPSEAEILGIISAPGNYQNRILRMYQTYLANKIEDIESVYATHRDREVELLYNLMLTFGPEPSNNSAYESHKKMLPTDKPSLRSRIKEMYAAYDPDMLASLETIFNQYAGREQILLNELIKSYGPEVPISSRSGPPSEILETYHKRVRHYYNKYERNPLDADIFIQLYKGREEEMMRILYARYGKDPDEELAIIPYRNRVIEYYKKYEPSLLSKVDETLAQFAGQEEMLLDALRARYEKCTPVPVEAPPIQRIRKMYETYNSSMLCNMDHILLKYKGRENELLQKLIAKHGPEPEEPRVLTPPAQPEPTPVEEISSKTELVVNEPQSIQEETKPEQKQAESDTLSKIISSHSSTSKDTVDIKTRVMHMFMRYDPERLPCVESIMGQYVGKEDEIIKHLVNVYGPEPSVGDVAWHVFLAANDRDKSESKSSLGNGSAKTVEDKMDLRTCMNNFCVRYDPDLIALMDDMFSQYAKQFEERVQSLFSPKEAHDPKQDTNTESVTGTISVDAYRRRLRNFFIKYAPGRVGTEDEVLKAHEGFEEEMMISFTRLYGPEPTGGEIGMMKTYYKPLFRKRVIALLSKYDPNQLESVDTLLATFDGAEDELLRHLVVKYGPEPTEQERLAELAQQRMAASMSLSGMELDTRARVINILSKYAPSRLAEVDGMVEVFKGKEEDLFRELTAMYRIEPTKEEALSKKCATAMRGPTPGSSRTDSQMSTTPCRSLDSPAPQPDLPSSLQRPTTISETRCNSNVVSAANMNRTSLVHIPAPGPSASTSFAPKLVVSTGAEQVFTRPPPNMPQQPPTPTAPQLQMDYRTRVCNFFTKYDPGNLPLLDEILEAYEGEEEHLLREMFLRYGPEPSNVEVAEVLRVAWVMYYREKLSELYSAHDPERLKCIDEDLEKYAGHEAELLESLTFLYSDIEMRKKAGESHAL